MIGYLYRHRLVKNALRKREKDEQLGMKSGTGEGKVLCLRSSFRTSFIMIDS